MQQITTSEHTAAATNKCNKNNAHDRSSNVAHDTRCNIVILTREPAERSHSFSVWLIECGINGAGELCKLSREIDYYAICGEQFRTPGQHYLHLMIEIDLKFRSYLRAIEHLRQTKYVVIGVRHITRIAFRKHTHTQQTNCARISWVSCSAHISKTVYGFYTHFDGCMVVRLFLFYRKRVPKRRWKLKRDTQKDTWKNEEKVNHFFALDFHARAVTMLWWHNIYFHIDFDTCLFPTCAEHRLRQRPPDRRKKLEDMEDNFTTYEKSQ